MQRKGRFALRFTIIIHSKKEAHFAECSKRTLGSFIRLTASDIASQFYYATHSYIVLRTVLAANKIPLKP